MHVCLYREACDGDDAGHEILDIFLSEEESEILNAEIRRLKKCSFICKLMGGRPRRGMVRDMLQVALMDRVPQIKNVDNMG